MILIIKFKLFNGKTYYNNSKWFRGNIYRLNHLPLILYKIRNYLLLKKILLSNKHEDGRINSSIDENIIIDIIIKKLLNAYKNLNQVGKNYL